MTAPHRVVVDTSVVVKWYVPEEGSTAAAALLAGGDRLLAPDLLVPEFGNVLWKKVVRGELTNSEAEQIVDAFISSRPVHFRPASAYLRPAFDIAVQMRCAVYDALYLALAVSESCSVVTADEKLAQVLRGTPFEQHVVLLGH